MSVQTVIYAGFCHACNTRVYISQPPPPRILAGSVPRADASSGKGVCPVCGRRIVWKASGVAMRAGSSN